MKMAFLILCLQLVSVSSFAGGAGAPSSPSGNIQCRAYDVGEEEHNPHYSCGECLSQHGNCDMRCYDYDSTCTYKGQRATRDDKGNITYRDEQNSATDRNEYRAREIANYRCMASGLVNCQFNGCSQNSHEISSNQCQRGARPGDINGEITIRH